MSFVEWLASYVLILHVQFHRYRELLDEIEDREDLTFAPDESVGSWMRERFLAKSPNAAARDVWAWMERLQNTIDGCDDISQLSISAYREYETVDGINTRCYGYVPQAAATVLHACVTLGSAFRINSIHSYFSLYIL